jgi:hypothetical protein
MFHKELKLKKKIELVTKRGLPLAILFIVVFYFALPNMFVFIQKNALFENFIFILIINLPANVILVDILQSDLHLFPGRRFYIIFTLFFILTMIAQIIGLYMIKRSM